MLQYKDALKDKTELSNTIKAASRTRLHGLVNLTSLCFVLNPDSACDIYTFMATDEFIHQG